MYAIGIRSEAYEIIVKKGTDQQLTIKGSPSRMTGYNHILHIQK
jgi:hypothetical protein